MLDSCGARLRKFSPQISRIHRAWAHDMTCVVTSRTRLEEDLRCVGVSQDLTEEVAKAVWDARQESALRSLSGLPCTKARGRRSCRTNTSCHVTSVAVNPYTRRCFILRYMALGALLVPEMQWIPRCDRAGVPPLEPLCGLCQNAYNNLYFERNVKACGTSRSQIMAHLRRTM